MATRSYVVSNPVDGVYVITWEGLLRTSAPAAMDDGAPFVCPQFADMAVQVVGTYGTAGEVTIEGTNFTATPTYATLNDAQGNPLVLVAADPQIEQVLENVYAIRPRITNGQADVTDLDVRLLVTTTARR